MSVARVLNEEPSFDRLLARINEMPVLPHVVFKVMEISGGSESPDAELERVIVVDPGFSSRLITLANSAYYALPRKVTSVREAIGFLGFKAIRQLAMTVGVFDMFIGKNDKDSLRRRRWWRQSVDTAVCCRFLADRTKLLCVDDAYTCGLLHFIGKTLLDRFGEDSYEKVELLQEHEVDCRRAEQAVLGCNHIKLAVGAAEKWGFPEELVAGLEYLDQPHPSNPLAMYPACVAIGHRIAEIALHGVDERTNQQLPVWALEQMGRSQSDGPELIAAGMDAIAAAASIQL